MQNLTIHEAFSKFRITDKDTPFNTLSMGSAHCKAGKWNIPDANYEQFLKQINEELVKNPSKQMHYLEKPHLKYNMIKIDLDLRFNATEEEINFDDI